MSAFPYRLTTLSAALSSALLISTFPQTANAAGYGINENSASYMGTGFAGRASNPIDASIAANNPAGISFVKDNTVSVGSAVILQGGEFEGEYYRPPIIYEDKEIDPSYSDEGKTKDFQKTTPVPFGHFVMPINDRFSFGLSGYGPFGIELDYKDDWPGRYFGDETSVKVMNLQGTLSYKPCDDLSIGFGLIGSYVKGKLTQQSGVPGFLPLDANIEGDDSTVGWNLGALWRVTDRTMIGVVYHSKLDFTLKGDIKVRGDLNIQDFPLLTIDDKIDASLAITMPERAAVSITHKLDDRWTVMADATWTRWSRFEEFYVKAKRDLPLTGIQGGPSLNPSSYIPMKWKDVWALSIGASYSVNTGMATESRLYARPVPSEQQQPNRTLAGCRPELVYFGSKLESDK